jgi:toxin-antitoxin system PIN domain toxin
MIAVDTNVLVYAHREELRKHTSARDALVQLAEGRAAWAIPVFCLGEFLRVITHRRVFDPPHTTREATAALSRLLASPTLNVLSPGPEFPKLLLEAVREADASGNLVFDAQVVAVCREAGAAALLTEDRDFDRFRNFPVRRLSA